MLFKMNRRVNTVEIRTKIEKRNIAQPYEVGNKYYMLAVHTQEADY